MSFRCLASIAGAWLLLLAGAAGAVQFTDVTVAAGVDYVQQSVRPRGECLFGSGFGCEPERMTGGAAVGDVDGDGWVDLFVTRLDASDLLFRNRGDGTFEDWSAQAGFASHVRRSNGALFADIDNDGDLDLYVTTLAEAQFDLFINDGTGNFSEDAVARNAAILSNVDRMGFSIAAGDYDRDGFLDLHVNEWRGPGNYPDGSTPHTRLLRNRGAQNPGHFEDVTVQAGVLHDTSEDCIDATGRCFSYAFSSVFSDLDGDGWPDLAMASDFGDSRLFWNNGDGTFSDGTADAHVATDENGMGSTLGDFDGDGDLDWFVTSIFDPDFTCDTQGCGWGYSGNRLYRNDGNRSFSDATDAAGVRIGHWGWGAAFFDPDNDGDLDLAMTNGVDFPTPKDDAFADDPMRYWENDGAGQMSEISGAVGLADTASGKGLLVFDYDRDGDQDLFIANNGGAPRLYRNDGGNLGSWLRVELEGVESNRQGLGARIYVQKTPGSEFVLRELGTDSHFLGNGERVAHFGLGNTTQPIAKVRIEWPSGRVQELDDVSRNGTLWVREPGDDTDADGVPDSGDNCPGIANGPAAGDDVQSDLDADGVGDACDNCVDRFNPRFGFHGQPHRKPFQTATGEQPDDDADGFGNACDAKRGFAQSVVGGWDLFGFYFSFNRPRSGNDCGLSGSDACATYDLDNAGSIIGVGDLVRAQQLFNRPPGPTCSASPLACRGPACP